jgi:hypothetical protein
MSSDPRTCPVKQTAGAAMANEIDFFFFYGSTYMERCPRRDDGEASPFRVLMPAVDLTARTPL